MNKKVRWAGIGVLAAGLFAGGIGVGSAVADPTVSDEYAAVVAEKDTKQSQVSDLESKVGELESKRAGLQKNLDAARSQAAALESEATAVAGRETAVAAAETALKQREDAVKGAETAKAASSIKEGTWTVGRNVEAGTYTTEKTVASGCYWAILASGTNGDDILANDIVSGGQPTVTIQAGQDFTTKRCGTWTKIG